MCGHGSDLIAVWVHIAWDDSDLIAVWDAHGIDSDPIAVRNAAITSPSAIQSLVIGVHMYACMHAAMFIADFIFQPDTRCAVFCIQQQRLSMNQPSQSGARTFSGLGQWAREFDSSPFAIDNTPPNAMHGYKSIDIWLIVTCSAKGSCSCGSY